VKKRTRMMPWQAFFDLAVVVVPVVVMVVLVVLLLLVLDLVLG
jgi:hypothetical protein